MTRLQDSKAILKKKMGAVPIGETYMKSTEEVYVVRQRDKRDKANALNNPRQNNCK